MLKGYLLMLCDSQGEWPMRGPEVDGLRSRVFPSKPAALAWAEQLEGRPLSWGEEGADLGNGTRYYIRRRGETTRTHISR